MSEWVDLDKVRFVEGRPETIGGWEIAPQPESYASQTIQNPQEE